MATPRVFVSSTCYDLQEVRFQLHGFIADYGYEPVMSEFGDIFYDAKEHVHDACLNEIGRCQLFLLIIGNNYGSLYHRSQTTAAIPDSVTLAEFRTALQAGVTKFIFVNRFVDYDFKNYRRALKPYIAKYFAANKVPDDETERKTLDLKAEFDKTYHFPQEQYRSVFYFLEIFDRLELNNAQYPFESFDDIKATLRKQWAAMMYDSLGRANTVPVEVLTPLHKKLDAIESQLRMLAATARTEGDEGRVSLDLSKLNSEFTAADLAVAQVKLDDLLEEILYTFRRSNIPRLTFDLIPELVTVIRWCNGLSHVVQTYKWSRHIPIPALFEDNDLMIRWWKERENVPFAVVYKLGEMFRRLDPSEHESFATTVQSAFRRLYKPPHPAAAPPPGDDIPF